jgi:hypothetical protein
VTGHRKGAVARVEFFEPSGLELAKKEITSHDGKLKAKLITAEAPPSNTGEFLALVTSAGEDDQLPMVERSGSRINLRFPDGSRWQVEVSDDDITARPR